MSVMMLRQKVKGRERRRGRGGGARHVQLTELARPVDEGHLRPQVGAVYPLTEAARACGAKAAGGSTGRDVLQP